MEMLAQTLPIIIYFLLIVLLVFAIVIGIKMLMAMNKVEKMIDDVSDKINSLNGLFGIVDIVTDKISSLSDLLVNIISSKITNLFTKKSKKSSEEEREEEEYE